MVVIGFTTKKHSKPNKHNFCVIPFLYVVITSVRLKKRLTDNFISYDLSILYLQVI